MFELGNDSLRIKIYVQLNIARKYLQASIELMAFRLVRYCHFFCNDYFRKSSSHQMIPGLLFVKNTFLDISVLSLKTLARVFLVCSYRFTGKCCKIRIRGD